MKMEQHLQNCPNRDKEEDDDDDDDRENGYGAGG